MLKWLIVNLLSALTKFTMSGKATALQVPSLDSGNLGPGPTDWGCSYHFPRVAITECAEGRGLSC